MPLSVFLAQVDFAVCFVRVLKFFAVCCGLLLACTSRLTQGKRAPARRNPLQTFAKKFLMHAPKSHCFSQKRHSLQTPTAAFKLKTIVFARKTALYNIYGSTLNECRFLWVAWFDFE
jgi:hypothetical protein